MKKKNKRGSDYQDSKQNHNLRPQLGAEL